MIEQIGAIQARDRRVEHFGVAWKNRKEPVEFVVRTLELVDRVQDDDDLFVWKLLREV